MPPIELSKISATQLETLPRDKSVFFFPVGPLEDHGPHLPLGLDLEEAVALSKLAAEKLEKELQGWKGVLMPQAPLGIDCDTTSVAFTVRGYVLRDWLIDSCRVLKRMGFRHFVCISGNLGPRQLTAIEEAGKKISGRVRIGRFFSSRPTLVSACSSLVPAQIVRSSPIWPDPEEHGGKRDTSVALSLSSPVAESIYSGMPQLRRDPSFWSRAQNRLRKKLNGYWGNPAAATAEEGSRILTGTVDQIFPKLRAVWEGANPEFLFRSWYSIIPLNKPNFKAWVLAALILALMIALIYLMFGSPLA